MNITKRDLLKLKQQIVNEFEERFEESHHLD